MKTLALICALATGCAHQRPTTRNVSTAAATAVTIAGLVLLATMSTQQPSPPSPIEGARP